MIFYRVSTIGSAIAGPLRADVCRTLRSLVRWRARVAAELVGRFGNETRVLRRFLQGRSSTPLRRRCRRGMHVPRRIGCSSRVP